MNSETLGTILSLGGGGGGAGHVKCVYGSQSLTANVMGMNAMAFRGLTGGLNYGPMSGRSPSFARRLHRLEVVVQVTGMFG